MKPTILLLAFSVAAFTSCTTAYKTGQTPDDVYYSPAKPQEEYVETEKKEEDRSYSYNEDYYDDRFLRMKVRNRYRWSDLDSWYGYDRYSIGYNYTYGSFNNPFNAWSYYYNPYCCCHNNVYFVNPKIAATPPVVKRHFSLAGYTNSGYNNSNNNNTVIKTPGRTTTTSPSYNNSNKGLSNKVKTIFSNDNSGNGSSRTYNPSTSSGSSGNNNNSSSGSSGNSGGSSGGVKRPTRN